MCSVSGAECLARRRSHVYAHDISAQARQLSITATIRNSFFGSTSMPESISTKRLWIMRGLMTIP